MLRRLFVSLCLALSVSFAWSDEGGQKDVVPAGGCCSKPQPRICVEVPPPEIVIQRAHVTDCRPPILQRCNHFRIHQWTHMSGHGHGTPMNVIPHAFVAPQSFVMPQSTMVAPQSFVMPQSTMVAPQSFVIPQSTMVAPQSFVMPQSTMVAPQSFVMPQSTMVAPQSFVMPQSTMVAPQSFVIPQSTVQPQSNVTPQSSTSDMDIKEAVKRLSENLKTASELLNKQAEILKVHDDKIDSITKNLNATNKLLAPLKGYTLEVDAVTGVVTATKNKK